MNVGFSAKLMNRVRADGWVLGPYHLLARAGRTVRSRLYGKVLGAQCFDIGAGCHIKGIRHIRFGSGISIFKNMWLEAVTQHHGHRFNPVIEIGDGTSFSNNVHISSINRICIGSHVLVGSNVHITDHNHGSYGELRPSLPGEFPAERLLHTDGPVLIADNVWIGDNVVIIGPVHIGAGAIIGSNSVVLKDVAAATIAAGSPARALKVFDHHSGLWRRVC